MSLVKDLSESSLHGLIVKIQNNRMINSDNEYLSSTITLLNKMRRKNNSSMTPSYNSPRYESTGYWG